MARRYNPRAVKVHHTYTIEQAAETLEIHIQTVRAWVNKGLPCMRDKKPFLILGAHLRIFLEQLNANLKTKLEINQIYCLRCRAGKIPARNMADYVLAAEVQGRLIGICPDCDSICNRFMRKDLVEVLAPSLDVIFRTAVSSLNDTDTPALKPHIKQNGKP